MDSELLQEEMRGLIDQGVRNGGYEQAEADRRFRLWRDTFLDLDVEFVPEEYAEVADSLMGGV